MRDVWDGEQVGEDEPIWRYFRVERFVEALDSGTLYFAAARQFADPFEGATAVVEPHPVDPRFDRLDHTERAFEQLRRLTKISCWNRGSYESEAMWKLYAGERKGVAIRTTVGALAASVRPFRLEPNYGHEDAWWGRVRYCDLSQVRLRVNNIQRFFCKHMAFESEREFRIAIPLTGAADFGVTVPDDGISVAFAPDLLIEKIVLGPDLSGPERHQVEAACDRANLGSRVHGSTLLWWPRYT